jgi:DNA helicase-2/ATP-dependent DNA helicase PcrA
MPTDFTPEQYTADLNDEQLRAVTAPDGPFLIVAGAGTGKTMAITRRIAWLIASGKAKPEEILALTFTDKAAGEMAERVDQLLPLGYVDLQISTFHSFCEKLLKEHGLAIGLPDDFTLVNQTDAYLLVRRRFDRFDLDYYRPLGNPTKFIHALLSHFSRAKDEAVLPEEYLEAAAGRRLDADAAPEALEEQGRLRELAGAYHAYQRLLLESDSLDFGDLQMYAIELLRRRPAIRAALRARYKYVLVDEFQDTNWAQYEFVKLLVPPDGNLMVVGDDDQSIYKFRGASVANILQFKHDFPGSREVVLTRNYRSLQGILDLAYAFIRRNDPNRLEAKLATADGRGISKRLTAHREGPAAIEPLRFDTLDDEAEGVVRRIAELRAADPELTWSDFCVLVRSNSGAEAFSEAFERAGVPFQFLALKGLYAKPVVMDTLAYLALLDDYHESAAMYRTLCSPPYQVDAGDLVALTHEAKRRSQSLYETGRGHHALDGLREGTRATLDRLMRDLDRHAQVARDKSAEEVMVSYLFDSGYLRLLTETENLDTRQALMHLDQLRKRIRRFAQRRDERSLRHFMEEFALERESGERGGLAFDPETGPDMVRIMTVHASKGLEFRHVFIVSLVDKRFPSAARSHGIELPEELTKEIVPEGDIHLEEERRLMYVAMTRAKDGLYLTWADDYGGKAAKKPSRFLVELGYAEDAKGTGKAKGKARAAEGFAAPAAAAPRPAPESAPPAHYSFSSLEAYSMCPLQYKFAHVLRIPTMGHYQASFGKTLHATLEWFYGELARAGGAAQGELFGAAPARAGERLPGELAVGLRDLLAAYDRKWLDDWYPDKPTKEKWREIGRQALARIHAETRLHPPDIYALEQSFTLKVGERTLKGSIDRLDRLADGTTEIIDYKTGRPKGDDDLKADGKRQLYIYQMAAQQLGLKPSRLTFYYLQDGSRVSFLGSEKDLAKVAERAAEQMDQIEGGDFAAKPGPQCKFCDFKAICDKAE